MTPLNSLEAEAPPCTAPIKAPPDGGAAFARQIHDHVRDLMAPRARVYWTDFLITIALAYASLGGYFTAATFSALQAVSGIVASLALYRASVFIHELAHLPSGRFRAFRAAWNALFGVPFMTPSFLYEDHKAHHVNHHYATPDDGEYFPLGRGPVGAIHGYMAQILVLPVAAPVRFAVLTPLSWLIPPLRRWVWERASTLVRLSPGYRRPPLSDRQRLPWLLQEGGCCAAAWTAIVLTVTGVAPPWWWLELYPVVVLFLTLNYLRGLGAHRYLNDGREMTYLEQMLDSTTIIGSPVLGELWAPLGMRYHALHHLVPSLPYHSLGPAHRRLMERLPADSPYRETLRRSLWAALREVYRGAKAGPVG